MKVIRRAAVQGHAIPTTAHRPQGPWPAEVMAQNEIVAVEPDDPDPRAHAQNNYQAPHMVRCVDCLEVLYSDETDSHRCAHG